MIGPAAVVNYLARVLDEWTRDGIELDSEGPSFGRQVAEVVVAALHQRQLLTDHADPPCLEVHPETGQRCDGLLGHLASRHWNVDRQTGGMVLWWLRELDDVKGYANHD